MWYFDVAYNLKYSYIWSIVLIYSFKMQWSGSRRKLLTPKIQVSIRKWPTWVNVLNYLSTLKNHHDKLFGHLGEERTLRFSNIIINILIQMHISKRHNWSCWRNDSEWTSKRMIENRKRTQLILIWANKIKRSCTICGYTTLRKVLCIVDDVQEYFLGMFASKSNNPQYPIITLWRVE